MKIKKNGKFEEVNKEKKDKLVKDLEEGKLTLAELQDVIAKLIKRL
jgi:hypothetical protein